MENAVDFSRRAAAPCEMDDGGSGEQSYRTLPTPRTSEPDQARPASFQISMESNEPSTSPDASAHHDRFSSVSMPSRQLYAREGTASSSFKAQQSVDWHLQREISGQVVQEQMRRAASIHLQRIRGRESTVFTRMTAHPQTNFSRSSFDGGSYDMHEEAEHLHAPIHPHSVLKTLWDVIVCLTTIMTLVVDPVSLAFTSQLHQSWYLITDRIVMSIFMLDVVINFISGFTVHETARVELQWSKAVYNYLTGWFLVDVTAALPAEAFNGIPQISMLRGARLVQAGVHAIKVSKVAGFAQRLRLNVDINLPPFVWKLVAWTVGLLLWLHLAACLQCWVWFDETDEDYLEIDEHVAVFFVLEEDCLTRSQCIARYYLRAFRTACGYMLGHGQFSGQTLKAEIMVVVCSLSGSVLYKSFMSMCIQLLMLMDSFRVRHYSASKRLDQYMGVRNLPAELRFRSRKYLENAWDKLGGLDEGQVLGIMSAGLRGSIRVECSVDLIRSVPFFRDAPDTFVYRVAQVIKTDVFCAGDRLMMAGEFGLEMYLIKEGEVELLDRNDRTVCRLGPKHYFGENALATTLLRTSSVRALTEGMVFIIEKEDMMKIYERFPAMHRRLLEHTQQFQTVATATSAQPAPPSSAWRPSPPRRVAPTPPKAKVVAESFKLTRDPYVE